MRRWWWWFTRCEGCGSRNPHMSFFGTRVCGCCFEKQCLSRIDEIRARLAVDPEYQEWLAGARKRQQAILEGIASERVRSEAITLVA